MSLRTVPPGSLLKTSKSGRKPLDTGSRAPRQRDEKHLDFVRSLPCISCHTTIAVQAAHIRMAAPEHGKRLTGKAEKPDDRFTLPLCDRCHLSGPEAQHRVGEAVFWERLGMDAVKVAMRLHDLSGDHEAGEELVRWRWRYLR